MSMAEQNRKRILLLDDSPFFIARLKDLLGTMGYDTVEFQRVRAAQEYLASGAPPVDLAIIDLKMPDVDGFAFLRWVRAQPAWGELKVLVLTGAYELDEIVRPLRELRAAGLMEKGTHPHNILTRVNAILFPVEYGHRVHERVSAHQAVTYLHGGVRKQAVLTHVSLGGCFLVTEEAPHGSAPVEVLLPVEGMEKPIDLPGRVVWVMGGEGWKGGSGVKGMGVAWQSLPERSGNALGEFVRRRMEEERIYALLSP